jgi:hypothetical protein
MVDEKSGEKKRIDGAWGGSSPWDNSPVDVMSESIDLPSSVFVIKATEGGIGSTSASVIVHPSNLVLEKKGDELPEKLGKTLHIFKTLKPSYRDKYLLELQVSKEDIDYLVEHKYLSRNKVGSISITTKGKNGAVRWH